MTTEPVLEVTQHIAASPETIFTFFTDADRYVQWMGTEATIEASPGGAYRTAMRDGLAASGEFVEVDPPRRVVFTWGWEGHEVVAPGSTRVEVDLIPDDEGGTTVRLRHFDLPGQQARDEHRDGWTLYLDRLATVSLGGDPGPDPNA